jgi:hypothetical protein
MITPFHARYRGAQFSGGWQSFVAIDLRYGVAWHLMDLRRDSIGREKLR